MVNGAQASADRFDRVLGIVTGLPDVQMTKPATVETTLPIVGDVTQFIVRTMRSKESGFAIFVTMVDAEGRARFILPNRVAEAIYRQRQSLTDRSTPDSRKRARARAERKRALALKEKRRQAWLARSQSST